MTVQNAMTREKRPDADIDSAPEETNDTSPGRESSLPSGVPQARLGWPFVLVLLGVFAHCPIFWSGFVWDDISFQEMWLPEFDSLNALLWPPEGIPYWPVSYYRPLGVLTLKIDSIIWGTSWPIGWHLFNLMLHLIICWQVYALARRLLKAFPQGELGARFTSAVFAVHPIHVESVNWISGRSDPLAAVSVLAAVLLALGYQQDGKRSRLVGVVICVFLGLMCKELAIAALPLGVICMVGGELGRGKTLGKKVVGELTLRYRPIILFSIAVAVGTVPYLALRLSAGATHSKPEVELPASQVELLIRSAAFYIHQSTGAYVQSPVPPPLLVMPELFVAIITLLFTIAVCYFSTRKFGRQGLMVVVGAIWFFIAIGPSLLVAIQGLDRNFLSDRYLYLPSVGFCLSAGALLAIIAAKYSKKLEFISTIGVVIVLCLSAKTIWYGTYWVENMRIWKHTVQLYPENTIAWTVLTSEFMRQDMPEEQLDAARKAASSSPDRPQLLINLSIVARSMGHNEEALAASRRVVDVWPEWEIGWLEYGATLVTINQPDLGREALEKSLELDSDNAEAHVNLARVSDPSEAIEHLKIALEINPALPMAWNNLGVLHANSGNQARSIECFERALEVSPDFKLAIDNLAAIRED